MNNSTKIPSNLIAYIAAASLAACAWVAGAGSAIAAEPEMPLAKTVVYGDLNLDTAAGAQVLYSRLRAAAQSVCAPFEGRDLNLRSHWQACVDHAMASAVAQVNHAALTALYANRAARPPQG